MRLINARTMRFEEFYEDCTPPYAILSHTWEGDEVTFQDANILAKPMRICSAAQRKRFYITQPSTFSILTTSTAPDKRILTKFRRDGDQVAFPVQIRNAIPEGIWDDGEKIFYAGSSRPIRAITFDEVIGGQKFELAILLNRLGCKSTNSGPKCYIFDAREHRTLSKYLFRRRLHDNSLHWSGLEVDFPNLLPLPSDINFRVAGTTYRLTPRSQKEDVHMVGSWIPVFRLHLDIERLPARG